MATLLIAAPIHAQDAIRLLDGKLPPAVAATLPAEGLTALAGDADGNRFAAAVRLSEKSDRSELRLYTGNAVEPARLRVHGTIRDLWFTPDASQLFGILYRASRRGAGQAQLLLVDTATATRHRSIRLPPTAAALDYWSARQALLVCARDEVRTILLPGIRSGPLFRVPGNNLALASLDGAGQLLIGREEGIWRVDLNDRPDDHAMPVRERLETRAPVVSLAASRDGRNALARLADGSVLRVTPAPLSATPAGHALIVEATGGKAPPATAQPAAPPPATVRPGSEPPPVEAAPTPPAHDEPTPAHDPPSRVEPPPPASDETSPPEAPDADPPAAPVHGAAYQIRGRISGAAVGLVKGIVLLGPDSILREAKRVTPHGDGSWSVDGLAPGRYRIILDGGGDRLLVSRPAYVQVRVVEGAGIDVPPFEVLRAR